MRATQFAVASVLAGLGSCFVAVMPVAAQRSAPQPNIIHIVADDLGWADVGFHGSDITTPNIDQLAKTGATLERFYVQPMCTPTRAALMTGRYPLRYGLQTLVIPASLSYGLPTDEWLLPQALKEAGYTTAILGKWHLGHAKREFWPSNADLTTNMARNLARLTTSHTPSAGKRIGIGITNLSMKKAM